MYPQVTEDTVIPTTTLNVRGIDAEAAARIKRAAAARGVTIGEYLASLVALHDDMRLLAEKGDRQVAIALKARGLGTVTA